MIEPPPQLEDWFRVLGIGGGILVVVLTPVAGILKEYWSYKARVREAEPLRQDTARVIPGAALADSLAIGQLAEALKDLAAAIRADTASDEERDKDQQRGLIKELADKLAAMDLDKPHRRR